MGKNKPRSLRSIFRRMKNAVSHCNIEFESETANSDQIKYICFYDDENYKSKRKLENYEFQLKIDINNLKNILFDFCDNLLVNEEYAE